MDSSSPPTNSGAPPMEGHLIADDPSTWEWGTLFDFSIEDDDPLLTWPSSAQEQPVPSMPPVSTPAPEPSPASPPDGLGLIRKRDPRLVCSNFLAGRVPCACPELDEQEREEEEVAEAMAGAKKRVRVSVTAAGVRCQVPGCEADIRELKGYHRRHRVCLQCATAPSVVLDGEHKRYCQQCGKFHLLPDFDEGKRSCRRKLEWHNRRRRRRSTGSRSNMGKENELQGDLLADANCEEQSKEMMKASASGMLISNKIMNIETILESDEGHISPSSPVPSIQNVQSNSTTTFTASDETNKEEKVDYSKPVLSPSFSNKSAYSSVCPTGRISFKLYDWNPAEFPRRLRHQIFEWLANMPVELEGYIRPGCTILTAFIAMPQFMWETLSQDVALYVRDLVDAPESLFSGRGNILIHLSNKIAQIMRDGTSLMNIKMEVQVPRLHYVYPPYFEAGKSMEFVACGSNLDQPKFRFLVSFAGKYLACNSCCAIAHETGMLTEENARNSAEIPDHEMLRISITQTESKVFGPAFIEVENESGLSNFIPVLFGSRRVCSELARIEEVFDNPSSASEKVSDTMVTSENPKSCEVFTSRQTAMSDFLLDIAWLLKTSRVEESKAAFSSTNIQRITCLLEFLTRNEFVSILEEILQSLDHIIGEKGFHESVDKTSDADMELLMKHVNHARETVSQRFEHACGSEVDLRTLRHEVLVPHSSKSRIIRTLPSTDQHWGSRNKRFSSSIDKVSDSDETAPLVPNDWQHCAPSSVLIWPRKSWGDIIPRTFMNTRLAAFIMVGVVMCFGACIAVLHPHKAREFTVTLRRCLFGSAR